MPRSLADFDAQRKATTAAPAAAGPVGDAELKRLFGMMDADLAAHPDDPLSPTGKTQQRAGVTPQAVADLKDPGQGTYFKEHPYINTADADARSAFAQELERTGVEAG